MVEAGPESYDIIIVGAGPAGSSAAQAASKMGAEVLLIDRKQRVGVPVQCAEFVPQWTSRCIDFSPTCILQTVETVAVHLPNGACHEMRSPGYMLDRSRFDKELAAGAALFGAHISTETKVSDVSDQGVIVEDGPQQKLIRSKVTIGADGVHSTLARCMGQPAAKTIAALQYEVVIPKAQDHIDIFFHRDYEGGYAWFFPKGKTANAGLGVIPSMVFRLPDLLNDFLRSLESSRILSSIEILSKTGGSIPAEPRRQTVFGNLLLVGDAAGHAHPITGGGILNAVIGGEMAGRIAAQAVAKGDMGLLKEYEVEWNEAFGRSLSYGFSKREFLEKNWSKPGNDFEGLIRKTWVGFKEYYLERRGDSWNPG